MGHDKRAWDDGERFSGYYEYLYFTKTAACSGQKGSQLLKNMIVLTEGENYPQKANTGVYTQKLIVVIETT